MVEKIIGILSGLLIGCAQAIYLLYCLKKRVLPSVLSWFGWACLMGTSILSQVVAKGWEWNMLGTVCSTVGCLTIAATAFFSRHYSFKRGDLWFLLAGSLCVVVYLVSSDPWMTTIFAIVADACLSVPTVLKAWHDPGSERSASWVFGGLSAAAALVICVHHEVIYALFPVYLLIFNVVLVSLTRPGRIALSS